MPTTVHNLKTTEFKPGDIVIDRSTNLGNPFIIGTYTRSEVIRLYEDYARWRIESDTVFRQAVKNCYGKRLFCHCAPKPCHGDVLVKLSADLVELKE